MRETTGVGRRLVVIGAGPGGYPAAFLGADLGFEVTLIDPEAKAGGVCLLRGCIPSKALLHVAKLIGEAREAAHWGLDFAPPAIDLERLRGWKNEVIARMTGGLDTLIKARGIQRLRGLAAFVDSHTLQVALNDGGQETIEFDHAVIATGSEPVHLPSIFPASPRVLDSTSALDLEDVPETLLVVGGGYIGLELGTVYAALGSKVTVVEAMKELLPGQDRDLVDVLARRLEDLFDEVLLSTRVLEAEEVEAGIKVKLAGLDLAEPERVYDKVLVAVGRRPRTHGLDLSNTGVELDDHRFIVVDERRRTTEPHILAVGDVAGQPMLAHKATYEARIAIEALSGKPAIYDPQAIPAVVFTDPELAWCGLTETEAQTRGIEVKVAKFPWGASGRAATLGRVDGLTKMVIEPRSGRIVGMAIAGVGAGELIAEGALAVEMGALAEDVKLTIHAHPTLSETVMEAAELPFGPSTHYVPREPRRGR